LQDNEFVIFNPNQQQACYLVEFLLPGDAEKPVVMGTKLKASCTQQAKKKESSAKGMPGFLTYSVICLQMHVA